MTAPALSCLPIYFGPRIGKGSDHDKASAKSSLFGWYHPAKGPHRSTGVVLCNPIGDDYVRAHRTLRHLAEALSTAGHAVLRFDFYGTGDSAGSERDANVVDAWMQDIGLAVEELRLRSQAGHIAIVGLRLGATLAMAVAAGHAVDSLVLWSPYASGAAYVTETTKLHQMHMMLEPKHFASVPKDWNVGGTEALGFLLTSETQAALQKVDLRSVDRKPADHVLVIGTGLVPAEDPLLKHLRELGSVAEHRHFHGHKFLVQTNHQSDVPTPVIESITAWLNEQHPVVASAPTPSVVSRAEPTQPFDEQAVVFGSTHPLFGILVHPPAALRDTRRPAIIMTNAGSVHRIGPHRLYVSMARRWAQLGFSVFRIDLSGIGDSPAAPGCEENLTYPRDGLVDLEDAMTAVTAATGAEQFVILGLCSGGDLAFQLGFRDRRVAGAVMMNPRTFCINELDMVESYKNARYYEDSLFRVSSWRKALRGGVDLQRAAGMLVPKVTGIVKRRLADAVERLKERVLPADQVKREHNDVPACLRLMAERGVDTFLVASEKDPGVDFVDAQFGRAMSQLSTVNGFRREDFLGTDHTFTSLYAQERVSQVITDHLTAHHLS